VGYCTIEQFGNLKILNHSNTKIIQVLFGCSLHLTNILCTFLFSVFFVIFSSSLTCSGLSKELVERGALSLDETGAITLAKNETTVELGEEAVNVEFADNTPAGEFDDEALAVEFDDKVSIVKFSDQAVWVEVVDNCDDDETIVRLFAFAEGL
jgi:hypothetical protein